MIKQTFKTLDLRTITDLPHKQNGGHFLKAPRGAYAGCQVTGDGRKMKQPGKMFSRHCYQKLFLFV